MKERTFFILVILSALLIVPKIRSANDASRMATVQALVEHRTFNIDSTKFISTNDRVFINGNFYSDKPPFPSIIASVIYFPLYQFGFHLDYEWNFAYFIIIFFSVKLFWIISIFCFYRILKLIDFSGDKILFTSFLAFGSIYLSWSSTFNNHILAGSFLLIGFYFWIKSKTENFSNSTNIFLSGLFLLFAGISDVPTSLFFVGFLFILGYRKISVKKITCFLLPVLITFVPYLTHNYLISGSVLPFQINKHFFDYPGSVWNSGATLSGVGHNNFSSFSSNLFQMFLGSKGFLLYSPILFVSILSVIMYRKKFRDFSFEIGMFLLCSIAIVIYYGLTTNDMGGWSYSIRWFVPLLPFLVFMSFPFFEKISKSKHVFAGILLTVSIIISMVGIINPWSKSYYSENSFAANIYNVIHFYEMPR